MSSSSLRVELPAYSHSFEVQVTPSSTVLDVKHEIAKVCPGSPNPVGQRLVWRGRLLSDHEKIESLWKSPDDHRVIHLAVHPSAWTSSPPSLTPSRPSSDGSDLRPTPTQQPRVSVGQGIPTPAWQTPPHPHAVPEMQTYWAMQYLHFIHYMALSVLTAGAVASPGEPSAVALEAWRSAARGVYHSRSWSWPSIFDAPFPSGSEEEGAVYEHVSVQGLPYLQLKTPHATPTPAQAHALQVLSQTFAVMPMLRDPGPMYFNPPSAYPANPPTTDVNERLHQLGMPALRVANANPNDPNFNPLAAGGAPGAEIRPIPVRALMLPLLMLTFRTLLVLYFFSPSKRPLFGLVLSAWILYEAWNAMRLILNDGNERGADPAAEPAAGDVRPPAPQAPGAVAANVVPGRSSLLTPLDGLATLNLAAEDALLDTDAPAPPPSFGQRTKMFVSLFFMSFHPAAWDRRRIALRRREGRIRTEANARETAEHERAHGTADGQDQPRSEEDEARVRAREQMIARHERRPAWLKEYVQRVQFTEWVDDP